MKLQLTLVKVWNGNYVLYGKYLAHNMHFTKLRDAKSFCVRNNYYYIRPQLSYPKLVPDEIVGNKKKA